MNLKFWEWFKKKPSLWERRGYWNGNCPYCTSHIGIDIERNTILKKRYRGICPICNRNIYKKICSSNTIRYDV